MTNHGQVTDKEAEHRFELDAGGHRAIAQYRLAEGEIVFTHTLVPAELEGQGVGSALVAGALDQVRRKGLRVVPQCGFVRHYIETHPDTHDLLA